MLPRGRGGTEIGRHGKEGKREGDLTTLKIARTTIATQGSITACPPCSTASCRRNQGRRGPYWDHDRNSTADYGRRTSCRATTKIVESALALNDIYFECDGIVFLMAVSSHDMSEKQNNNSKTSQNQKLKNNTNHERTSQLRSVLQQPPP
jgi:hypothetical protein